MTQLNAIIGSCLKWWRIRYQGRGNVGDRDSCGLCVKYYEKLVKNNCEGCIIYEQTGLQDCGHTPFEDCNNGSPNGQYSAELQFLFDLIKPQYYPNVTRELRSEGYPMKFRTWMKRAITRKETS